MNRSFDSNHLGPQSTYIEQRQKSKNSKTRHESVVSSTSSSGSQIPIQWLSFSLELTAVKTVDPPNFSALISAA